MNIQKLKYKHFKQALLFKVGSWLYIASSQKTIIRCLVVVSSIKCRLGITANVIRLKRRVWKEA